MEAHQETRAVERVRNPGTDLATRLDPQSLIQQAIEHGSGIETLERLFALAKDVRAEQARTAWLEAMSQFQKQCPPILKTETAQIASKSGARFSYRYAALDNILRIIQPIMAPLGLSVSWRNQIETGRVQATCRVSHDFGHYEESGAVSVPIPDDSGASGPQRVGIALTYAKRYALLSIIGLSPEDDPDARVEDAEKRKVEQPRRASEQGQSQGSVDGDVIRCSLSNVTSRSGEKNGKPWTLYNLETDHGTFGTFDTKIAETASAIVGTQVDIRFTVTPKGGRNVVTIEPVEG